MDRPCSTGCGRQAERGSDRCATCQAILNRRTTWGSRTGVVCAPPPEAPRAALPSAFLVEALRPDPERLAAELRLAEARAQAPALVAPAKPWSKKGKLEALLGGPLEGPDTLLEELAPEPQPGPAAPVALLDEEQLQEVEEEQPAPGPFKARPLAKGERLQLKPGARWFMTTGQAAQPGADGDRRFWPPTTPPEPELVVEVPPAAAAQLDPTPPARPAQPEEPMASTAKNEKKLCSRCKEKPLRSDNETGICKDCRLDLGNPAPAALKRKLAQEGAAPRPAAAEPARRRAPAAEVAVEPKEGFFFPKVRQPSLCAFCGEFGEEHEGEKLACPTKEPEQQEIPGVPPARTPLDPKALSFDELIACLPELERRAHDVLERVRQLRSLGTSTS